MTIYTQKVNQGTGWRSQRKAAEAPMMEDGDGEGENNHESASRSRTQAVIGRPRGSKRTRGPRTAKGGLFRDYRPQLWDTPGADIRAGSTPERWDQLVEGGISDGRYTTTFAAPSKPTPLQPARSVHGHVPVHGNGEEGEEEGTTNSNSILAPARGENGVLAADEDEDDVEMDDEMDDDSL